LDIINQSTKKSGKKADIGDIEILEKFSFFEVEKSSKMK
jgi:ATP-dependent RNA helicase DeaD